jgi:hypothetical protein
MKKQLLIVALVGLLAGAGLCADYTGSTKPQTTDDSLSLSLRISRALDMIAESVSGVGTNQLRTIASGLDLSGLTNITMNLNGAQVAVTNRVTVYIEDGTNATRVAVLPDGSFKVTVQNAYQPNVAVTNTPSVTISGNLPAFSATPTVNAVPTTVSSEVLYPVLTNVNITATSNSFNLTLTNKCRMLQILNTNAGSVYLAFATNSAGLEITGTNWGQFGLPTGTLFYPSNCWLNGATGRVWVYGWYKSGE